MLALFTVRDVVVRPLDVEYNIQLLSGFLLSVLR